MNTVILQSKREFSVLRRHPWIFSGAIAHVEGNPGLGDTVCVKASDETILGMGAYSPESQIRVRMWTFGMCEINAAFIHARLVELDLLAPLLRLELDEPAVGGDRLQALLEQFFARDR